MVKEINAEEYSEIVNSSNPVVIDFHATWCGPCKVLSPILEELDNEIEGVEFVKLDVSSNCWAKSSYGRTNRSYFKRW